MVFCLAIILLLESGSEFSPTMDERVERSLEDKSLQCGRDTLNCVRSSDSVSD